MCTPGRSLAIRELSPKLGDEYGSPNLVGWQGLGHLQTSQFDDNHLDVDARPIFQLLPARLGYRSCKSCIAWLAHNSTPRSAVAPASVPSGQHCRAQSPWFLQPESPTMRWRDSSYHRIPEKSTRAKKFSTNVRKVSCQNSGCAGITKGGGGRSL